MLAAGQTLQQRYRVEGLLAQGGMGSVYRATHVRLGTPVALKELQVLSPDPAEQRRFREQFEIEARILAGLSHPNLARVTDFFDEGATAYLVMEFLEGRTLEEIVLNGSAPMDAPAALRVAGQLLDALEYLHTRIPPVVVRDLKPSNVMVSPDRRVRLIDFGIAKVLTPGQGTKSVIHGAGSEGFAPLEQYGMGSTDTRTDLYALGATLLFMLTRQVPPEAIARVTQNAPLPEPQTVNPSVTDGVWAAIQQLMALAPADRPESVAGTRQVLGIGAGTPTPPVAKSALQAGAVTGAASAGTAVHFSTTSAPGTPAGPTRPPAAGAPPQSQTASVLPPTQPAVVVGISAPRKELAWMNSRVVKWDDVVIGPPARRQTFWPKKSGDWARVGLWAVLVAGISVFTILVALGRIPLQPAAVPQRTAADSAHTPASAPSTSAPPISGASSRAGAAANAPRGLLRYLDTNAQGYREYVNTKDGSVGIVIPGGAFQMGDSDQSDNPPHSVTLPTYWISKYDVTNAQYRAFVNATGYDAGGDWKQYASQWGDEAPVVKVSWGDAVAYGRWAGLRLPTDQEWEKAARGTDGRKYPWGNEWDASRCRSSVGTSSPGPAPVGSYPAGASPYGCLDMAGNVWQWTTSRFDATDLRVLHGGSWNDSGANVFCGALYYFRLGVGYNIVGFRLARTL